LRIARRVVRRNLGRSLLVASLVAVPVAGATLVDGLFRTFQAPEREAYEAMGNADALIDVTRFTSLGDDYFPSIWGNSWSGAWEQRDPATVDLAAALPGGTELVPAPLRYFQVRLDRGDTSAYVNTTVAELGHELTDHRARLVAGTWPSGDDEVLVSRPLAERLDLLDGAQLRAGATVTFSDGPTVSVTGIGVDPFDTRSEIVFAGYQSAAADHVADDESASEMFRLWDGSESYLAAFPSGTDAATLWPALVTQGIALVPRDAVLNPERYEPYVSSMLNMSAEMLAMAGLVALIVGLGLLEVVLLAGAAFAVGARRQVRDLGLVASNGGTARHVRRIVLAQGMLLGVLGAVIGLIVGLALTIGGRPLWERVSGTLIDGWRFGTTEIAIAAGVGMLSGLAAAVVPARGAGRMKPIDALAQRFRATPLETHIPKLGLVLVALGSVGALVFSRVSAAELDDYAARIEAAQGTGVWVEQPNLTQYVALQLFGAVLAVAGLILVISPLIAVLARRMRRWPVSARFAGRDAARHRHRTTPAVAAIMIVIAGASGVAIGLTGSERVNELQYSPQLPENVMRINPEMPAHQADSGAIVDRADDLAAMLPGGTVVPMHQPIAAEGPWGLESVHLYPPEEWWAECAEDCEIVGGPFYVGGPDLYEVLLGAEPSRQTLQALADGEAVVFDAAMQRSDGSVSLMSWDDEGEYELARLDGHVIDYGGEFHQSLPGGLITDETAAEHGLDIGTFGAYIPFDEAATDDEIDAAVGAAEDLGFYAYVERGCTYCGVAPGVFLALVGGTALVTLVGVGVTVALAAVEGRADLATMAAVGASPRRRRAIAGWQALVVGGLGTVLGLALGGFYAYLIWPAIGAPDFTVPWLTIGLIGVAVPLLAVLVAVVFTPSRLPVIRRTT
jgi:putative ABC transport system permease protein